jgi:hypothetical protein
VCELSKGGNSNASVRVRVRVRVRAAVAREWVPRQAAAAAPGGVRV